VIYSLHSHVPRCRMTCTRNSFQIRTLQLAPLLVPLDDRRSLESRRESRAMRHVLMTFVIDIAARFFFIMEIPCGETPRDDKKRMVNEHVRRTKFSHARCRDINHRAFARTVLRLVVIKSRVSRFSSSTLEMRLLHVSQNRGEDRNFQLVALMRN